jgi:hypothetical protein
MRPAQVAACAFDDNQRDQVPAELICRLTRGGWRRLAVEKCNRGAICNWLIPMEALHNPDDDVSESSVLSASVS